MPHRAHARDDEAVLSIHLWNQKVSIPRGPKPAGIGPAKRSLLSSLFLWEWLYSVCAIHNLSICCNRSPLGCDMVAWPCRLLFPAPPLAMREHSLRLIVYPGGLPSLFAIIVCLSATLALPPGSTCHHFLCMRTWRLTTCPKGQVLGYPGQ